ncbi:hypothetical protein BJV82DRAFT_261506 [Fennellomyces sp. T-0311]|nr:hypothetical protein BJV82DRAFT_261506 [Fennellomyces sp. T-0311]
MGYRYTAILMGGGATPSQTTKKKREPSSSAAMSKKRKNDPAKKKQSLGSSFQSPITAANATLTKSPKSKSTEPAKKRKPKNDATQSDKRRKVDASRPASAAMPKTSVHKLSSLVSCLNHVKTSVRI